MMITIVMLVEIWDSEHGKERVNRSIWSNCGILGLGLDRVACGGDGEGGGGVVEESVRRGLLVLAKCGNSRKMCNMVRRVRLAGRGPGTGGRE